MSAHSAFSVQTFIVVLILVVYIFTSHYVEIKKVPYLHESVVAIIMGALTAVFIKLIFHQSIEFNNEIFFTFILPPIIFAAGYNLRKSLFFENFGIISFFGIVGTLLSFIVLSAFISLFNTFCFDGMLSTSDVMLLSSVLCATDTVAALSLVKVMFELTKQEQFPLLNSVLFGQGIINDAVAIIIFRSVSNFVTEENQGITFGTTLLIFGDFLYLLLFSLTVGVIFGLGISYFLKRNESFTRFPIKQTSLILLTGYSSYLFSELCSLSGIISLFTCSVIMGHYCYLNISEESQRGTVIAFDTVGYLAEAFVFAYLGICILSIDGDWKALGMAALLLLVLPLARAVSVYVLPFFYMICRSKFPLQNKEIKVCWYSGLIRGAIAFALCLQIESPNSSFLIMVTLLIVLFTTIFGSIFLKSFLNFIGIATGEGAQTDELYVDMKEQQNDKPASKYSEIGMVNQTNNTQAATHPSEGNAPEQPPPAETSKFSTWQKFENQYIKPTFIKERKEPFTYEAEQPLQVAAQNAQL